MSEEWAIPDEGAVVSQSPSRPKQKTSELFRAMADQIDRNEQSQFGGACVIVPPVGDPVQVLILNSQRDAAQFWGMLDATVKLALATLDDQARIQQGYGRR